MNYMIINCELKMVQEAGRQALKSLYMAREKLNKKKNQRLLGWIGKIAGKGENETIWLQDAAFSLTNAREDLEIFQKELQKISVNAELQADIHCFLSYVDFFFYGLMEEYLQQSQIEDSRFQVEEAIERVEYLLLQMERIVEIMGRVE